LFTIYFPFYKISTPLFEETFSHATTNTQKLSAFCNTTAIPMLSYELYSGVTYMKLCTFVLRKIHTRLFNNKKHWGTY